MNSDRHVLHVSSPFDKFMGLHIRNSESEKTLRRTPNDSEFYSDYSGNWVNQVPLTWLSLSFLTLLTKLSAWIFSGLRIPGFRQTLNLSSKKPYHTRVKNPFRKMFCNTLVMFWSQTKNKHHLNVQSNVQPCKASHEENTQAWPLICCQRCSTSIFHRENEVNFEHELDMFSKKPTILDVQVSVLF